MNANGVVLTKDLHALLIQLLSQDPLSCCVPFFSLHFDISKDVLSQL